MNNNSGILYRINGSRQADARHLAGSLRLPGGEKLSVTGRVDADTGVVTLQAETWVKYKRKFGAGELFDAVPGTVTGYLDYAGVKYDIAGVRSNKSNIVLSFHSDY